MASKKGQKRNKKKDGGSERPSIEEDTESNGMNFIDIFAKYCQEQEISVLPDVVRKEVETPETKTPKGSKKKGKHESGSSKPSSSTPTSPSVEESRESHLDVSQGPPQTPAPIPIVYVMYESKKESFPQGVVLKAIIVDIFLLNALRKTLMLFPTISSLKLKQCYLPGEVITYLAELLKNLDNIKELVIDSCPHPEQYFFTIVRDCSSLELLVLRGCEIDDEGVRMIADELYYKEDFKESSTLFYLNLSLNRIGDKGLQFLAQALRTNRTLVALTLTANLITDFGAMALGNVLKDFELNEDEVLDRRNHIYHRFKNYLAMKDAVLEQLKSAREETSRADKDKLQLNRGKSPRRKGKKKTGPVRLSIATQQELWKQADEEVPGHGHPYLREVFPSEKKLWCRGNLRLCHLNLSYNNITILGAEKFLQVVSYQSRLKRISPKLQMSGYPGLNNLILQGNLFPIHCPEMVQILGYMSQQPMASGESFLSLPGEMGSTPVDR